MYVCIEETHVGLANIMRLQSVSGNRNGNSNSNGGRWRQMSNKPRQDQGTMLAKQFQCVSKDLRTMQAGCLVLVLVLVLVSECVTSTSSCGRVAEVAWVCGKNFGLAFCTLWLDGCKGLRKFSHAILAEMLKSVPLPTALPISLSLLFPACC